MGEIDVMYMIQLMVVILLVEHNTQLVLLVNEIIFELVLVMQQAKTLHQLVHILESMHPLQTQIQMIQKYFFMLEIILGGELYLRQSLE